MLTNENEYNELDQYFDNYFEPVMKTDATTQTDIETTFKIVNLSPNDHSCYINDFSDSCLNYFSIFLSRFHGKVFHQCTDYIHIDEDLISADDSTTNTYFDCNECMAHGYNIKYSLQSTGWNQFIGRHIIVEKFLHTPKCNAEQKKYYQPRLVIHEFSGTKGKNNQKVFNANLKGVTLHDSKISFFFQIPQSYSSLKHSFYFDFVLNKR